MNHKLIFLLLCLMLSPCVDGWLFSRTRTSSTTVTYNNLYDVTCNANCIINGRRKRSAGSSDCDPVYPQKFEPYDLDDDNKITLEELAATTKCTKGQMSTDFDEADKNDDGYINQIEFQFAPFNEGQKLRATLYDLKAVGEWVSDSVSYHNAYGKTSVQYKVTEVALPKVAEKEKITET